MNFFKKNKYSILQSVLKYSSLIVVVFLFLFPTITIYALDGVDSGDVVKPTTIDNPIRCDDIPCFIEEIINIVLVVGVPIVALAIIYSGFLFVKAQGKPEELKTARLAIVYTLVGAALLLGAFILSEAIAKTVEDINKTS